MDRNKKIISLCIILSIISSSAIFIDMEDGFLVHKVDAISSNKNILYVGGNGPTNYTNIQDAIDNASFGDTVFVYNGAYYENIILNKSITLSGEDNNQTTIDGNNTGDVILMTADNTKVTGFKITHSGEGCGQKIYAAVNIDSNNNTISNNNITRNNEFGIRLNSSNNIIKNNHISGNCGEGIFSTYNATNNIIYNNYILDNCHDNGFNIWNISKTSGKNIIDGPYIGGNFWHDYSGLDYSGDGIGDTKIPHNNSGNIRNGGDYLPLAPPNYIPLANFIYAPLLPTVDSLVYFNDSSYTYNQDAPIIQWNWDFGDGNASTTQNTVHQYTDEGIYTVKLTVTDSDGKNNSISKEITVLRNFEFTLSQGWNLITLPERVDFFAEILGQNIPHCTVVSRFNASTQTFHVHVVGTPWDNFPIEKGVGYFVYVTTTSTDNIPGNIISNVSIPVMINWNAVGWYHNYSTTAESLGDNISGCTLVLLLDAETQTFRTHVVGTPWTDYAIEHGLGLFIYATESSIWQGEG